MTTSTPSAPVADTGNVATFNMPSRAVAEIPAPVLPRSFLWEFLMDGRTPARAMTDVAMQALLPAIGGQGKIIELGAGGDYYKRFVPPDREYQTSNLDLNAGCDLQLDMTRMDLADNSTDALVSVFALEHLYDFEAVFAEQLRVLKPGGRLLLVVPFMYYYHAAPDDYFRFTTSALDRLVKPLSVKVSQPLGGRWLLFSEFLHEKVIMGSKMGFLARLALSLVALPFLAVGLKAHDSRYAYLCEKEKES